MLFMGLDIQERLRRAIVVGGKQVGIWVAEALEKQGVNVKLIEQDSGRCELIAGILNNAIVIHGDGTDQLVLEEENIEGVDTFLALTSDDEDNIIASLLARRLGARKVVALGATSSSMPKSSKSIWTRNGGDDSQSFDLHVKSGTGEINQNGHQRIYDPGSSRFRSGDSAEDTGRSDLIPCNSARRVFRPLVFVRTSRSRCNTIQVGLSSEEKLRSSDGR